MKKHEECFAASRLMPGRVDRLSTEPLDYVSLLDRLLLLRTKLRSANIAPPQLDAQNPLHARQDLLVRGSGAPLEISDDARRRVALGGQVLLGHLGLHLLPPLRDDGAHFLADGARLDDIVGSVDLGQMLTFDTWFGGLGFITG